VWADVEIDAYHTAHAQGWDQDDWRYMVPVTLLRHAAFWIRQAVMRPVCKIKGHDVTLDEGGPDNPYVDAVCDRCGFDWPRRWW